MSHMGGIHLRQPYMAVDATTAIPAGIRLVAIVHTNSYDIIAFTKVFRDGLFKRAVAVRTEAHFPAIHINGGVHVNTVELYF